MTLIEKSLKDYLSPKYLGLSFATLLIPMIVLGWALFYGGGEIIEILSEGAKNGGFEFVDASEHPFLVKLLQFGLVKWIIVTFFYTIGGLFAVLLSLVIAMVVLGFLTPSVVKALHVKYYKHLPAKSMETKKVLLMMASIVLKFVLVFIICLPFVFIPFVINIPFFYLFYKFLIVDIGSNIMLKDDLKRFEKENFSSIVMASLAFFCLSLIPILGIFMQLFFVIYFTHFFFLNNTTCKISK